MRSLNSLWEFQCFSFNRATTDGAIVQIRKTTVCACEGGFRAHQASFVLLVFVEVLYEQVVLPLGFLQLQRSNRTVKHAKLCCSWRICNSRCQTWLPSLPPRRLDGDAAARSLWACCICCSHMRPREWGEMWRCGNSSKSAGSSSFSFTFTGRRKNKGMKQRKAG